MNENINWYITFGQTHIHKVNGKTFDRNCVALIQGSTPEECDKIAFEVFKGEFHQHSPRLPDMSYYPRGIIPLKDKGIDEIIEAGRKARLEKIENEQ